MFPIEFWNCYDRFLNKIPRSNNAVEGWHFRINSTLQGSHPTVWTCIEKLQKEQNYWEEEMHRIRAGLGENKQKKYIQLDERLAKIVPFYNNTLGTIEYLLAISTCIMDYYN